MKCRECYSEFPRMTPLRNSRECLKNHKQYICGTCGRCICIDSNAQGLQRWMFPFSSLEIAYLYLRTADISVGHACRIYQITNEKGRTSYRIFADETALHRYEKNHSKIVIKETSIQEPYHEYEETHIRMLTLVEVNQYLHERNQEI